MRRGLESLALALALPAAGAVVFEDVTRAAGLDFRHTIGDAHLHSLVEASGVGCAFLDYDNDGWLDIYLVNACPLPGLSQESETGGASAEPPTDRLYHNRGNGTFEDVTAQAGILAGGYGIGVTVGDYDNDGFPDLHITHYGPNRLYHNQGDGTFREIAESAGVAGSEFSTGACFADFDGDGWLDLFVGSYVDYSEEYNRRHGKVDAFPGPLAYPATVSRLYRNRGDGTFENAGGAAGITRPGRAMGVGAFDYDEDGRPDVFVSNDAMVNHLYHNEGGGRFVEGALLAGVGLGDVGQSTGAMAVETGDLNADGRLDLFVPDFTRSCLYLNLGGGFFDCQTDRAGVAQVVGGHIQWGAALADFDLDGDLDMYVSRGDANSLAGYPDCLLINNGAGHFTDGSKTGGSWFEEQRSGRGVVRGDFDNDGRIDLLITNLNDSPALLRNVTPRDGHHWLTLRLSDPSGNRDALGARVFWEVDGRQVFREHVSGGSYCSSHDPRIHLGLGEARGLARLAVRWPGGRVTELTDVAADRFLSLAAPCTARK
ncbi:MAG: CRTAC1 family protein [Verrucomicrobiales bacterium]|nr:CRTAC1 family protein [Verrucomicrobiales bacterium]MCP5526388.1 CRTAC1 family protein [Verrucomicrobiales bacterium]